MVSNGPMPPEAKSRLPESSASFIARAAGELHPLGLEIDAGRRRMLFQELLLLHDGERQIGNAELLGDADGGLRFGLTGNDGERDRGGQPHEQLRAPNALLHESLPLF